MSAAYISLEAASAGQSEWAGEPEWAVSSEAEELADALRSAMSEQYADASDEAMYDAIEAVLNSVSPAEAFSLSRALDQAAKSATKLVKDPTFIQVASVAAPIVGGLIGGPVGAGLGTLASNALLGAAAPPPAAPPPAPPAPAPSAPVPPSVTAVQPPAPAATPSPPPPLGGAGQPSVPAQIPSSPAPPPESPQPPSGPAASLAGGSTAAAQALVLTQQPDVLRSLLATALGRHGRRRVSGIPVAQVLALISQVIGQAAADADQLLYTEQQAEISEGVPGEAVGDSYRSLYADLIGADNLELAEAAEREGLV